MKMPYCRTILLSVTLVALIRTALGQYMIGSNNLSELTNPAIARQFLGSDDYTNYGNAGSALVLNAVTGVHQFTLNSATCALTITTWSTVRNLTLVIKQDATGNRAINWAGVTAFPPTIDNRPNAFTIVTLFTVDGGTTVFPF